MDQNSRLRRIQEWLKNDMNMNGSSIFFEVNDTTLKYLELKMEQCCEETQNKLLLKKALKNEIHEVRCKNSSIVQQLKQIKLSYDDVSPQSRNYINVINNAAVELGILSPSKVSLLIAIRKLCSDIYHSNERHESSTQLLQSLDSKLQDIADLKEAIEGVFNDLEKNLASERTACEKRLKNQKRVLLKIPEYHKTVSDLEKTLKDNGYSNDIRQGNLMKIYQILEEIDTKIRPLRLEIDKYCNLPHDMEESRLQLMDTKMKLEEMDKKLSDIFNNMTLVSQD